MRAGVTIKGLDEIDRALRQVAPSKQAVTRALLEGGNVIAERARQLVPVRTGNLRASIAVGTEKKGFNFARETLNEGGAKVYIGPVQGRSEANDGFYGHMVEFGTINAPAQPFMRPAFEASEGQARIVVGRVLSEEISKVGR